MQPSRLKTCVLMLNAIEQQGTLKHQQLRQKLKVNQDLLDDCLRILIDNALVLPEAGDGTSTICSVTQRGKNVLRFFNLPPK